MLAFSGLASKFNKLIGCHCTRVLYKYYTLKPCQDAVICSLNSSTDSKQSYLIYSCICTVVNSQGWHCHICMLSNLLCSCSWSAPYKNKCTKALNLLRVVAHISWGANQQTLLHLYRSLVRSKLEYGCIVYGSARGSYLQMLDPVQNHALRLCLGEPPLYIRRRKLSIQYCLKLSSSPQNPTPVSYTHLTLPTIYSV